MYAAPDHDTFLLILVMLQLLEDETYSTATEQAAFMLLQRAGTRSPNEFSSLWSEALILRRVASGRTTLVCCC